MAVAPPSIVRIRALVAVTSATAVALVACSDDPTSSSGPTRIELAAAAISEAPVGSTVTPAPTFVIRDAAGRAVAGIPVTVTVIEGEGEVRNPPRQSSEGPAAIGEWSLGAAAGVNAIAVRARHLAPLVISIRGLPDVPAGISVAAGAGQAALAGDVLPQPIDLKLHDRFGNGIHGQTVNLELESGGGTVSPTSLVTDDQGIAKGVIWRLGARGGAQRVRVTAGEIATSLTAAIKSEFTADLRFFGQMPSDEIQQHFRNAIDRIEASVIGDLPDVPLFNFDVTRCGVTLQPVSETIDDMVIYATVTAMDGPGRVLASAGPCITRTQSRFTVIGVIRFDIDDVGGLLANGRFGDVVLHELLHIVGVGPQWRSKDLIIGSGTSDPRFTGSLAASQCAAAGGAGFCGSGTVPIENTGGAGTAEVHWRESVFDAELMTGFAEATPGMPLSMMTLASIEDLGLTVNPLAADAYFITASARAAPSAAELARPPWETVTLPPFEVTPDGWVRPVRTP